MVKITEGSPEWFRARQRIAADYIRTLDAIEAAGASVERIVHEWQALDEVLKGALFRSSQFPCGTSRQ
jgi:hypothetical protein